MQEYKKYNFEETDYYLVNDIYDFSKEFFYGCRNNPKNIIKKKKIKQESIYFAYKKKGKWIKSTTKYNRAKLITSTQSRRNRRVKKGETFFLL